MDIAVLGTGIVGQTIGTKLVELGHNVRMGSRTATNETAIKWAQENNASSGTFNESVENSEVIFNCVNGTKSLEALSSIGSQNLDGKVLIDVANELDVVKGKPVSLASAQNSLAQKIQDAYPKLKVVKSLNTISCFLMVDPHKVSDDHSVFISGNDSSAKEITLDLLQSFGWKPECILDLGGIESAIGPEMYMSFWLSLYLSGNGADNALYNVKVCK